MIGLAVTTIGVSSVSCAMAKPGQIIVKTAESADAVFFLLIIFLVFIEFL